MTKSLGLSTDRATEYCTYCPKLCRFSCPVAEVEHRETVTPWGLMRLLEYARRGTVAGSEEVAETFFHCTACARCQTWCKHDNDVPQAMFQARGWMHDRGYVPQALDGFSDFFLEANAPHRVITDLADDVYDAFDPEATIGFFPDCETRRYQPDLIRDIGRLLEVVLGQKVRLLSRPDDPESEEKHCCGFPLAASGDTDAFAKYAGDLTYDLLGMDEVITDCAAFVAMTRTDTFADQIHLPVTYLFETLDKHLRADAVRRRIALDDTFLHDSCFTARHIESGAQITRRVLSMVVDGEVGEFSSNKENTTCCGGAAHYRVVAQDHADEAARVRIEQMEREGGARMVCAGETCGKHMRRAGADVTPLIRVVCDAVLEIP